MEKANSNYSEWSQEKKRLFFKKKKPASKTSEAGLFSGVTVYKPIF
jgi:hypothetical protein